MIHKFKLALVFLAANMFCGLRAHADMMSELTQKAILNNPDVLSRWHTFNSAVEEVRGAKAGYYPKVDVTANSGREYKSGVSVSAGTMANFNRNSTKVELTQMLWDGFATRDEIRRLNHAQLTRHYELLDITENTALEAVRSYNDVLRNRELYALTEENYIYHRTVFEQIQNKVKAGVGRKVDLEQISGRVALSESNLVTDRANMHDVSARFQRYVGIVPPQKLDTPTPLADRVPLNAYDAHLAAGLESNPSILAAIENIRSAQNELEKSQAKYQPRLDLRLSESRDHNSAGTPGTSTDKMAEITLTWNLFSGGADVSRARQNFERIDVARGQRDSACRNTRQTLAIAYNDVWKLTEQLRYLEQHQLAIEKARTAYQKQFDIGQRSLLDLLDTENELYQAKRSYINGKYDLNISYARTLAAMGKLTNSLGLTHLELPDLPAMEFGGEAPENCPPEGPPIPVTDKDELNQRAREKAKAALEAAAVAQAKKEAEAAKAEADAAEAARFAAEAEAARIASSLAKPGGPLPKLPTLTPSASAPASSADTAKFAAEAAAAAKFAGTANKTANETSRFADEAAAAARFAGVSPAKPSASAATSETSKFAEEAAAAAKFAGAAPKPASKNTGEAARFEDEAAAALRFAGAVPAKPPVTPASDEASRLAAEAAVAAKFAGADKVEKQAVPVTAPTIRPAPVSTPTGPVPPPESMLELWLKDWENKNLDAYLAHYDVTFVPGNGKSRHEWEAERRTRIGETKSIKLAMDELEIVPQSAIKVTAIFKETITVNGKKRVSIKQIELIREGTTWFIQEEKVLKKRPPLTQNDSAIKLPWNTAATTNAATTSRDVAAPSQAVAEAKPSSAPVKTKAENNQLDAGDDIQKIIAEAEQRTRIVDASAPPATQKPEASPAVTASAANSAAAPSTPAQSSTETSTAASGDNIQKLIAEAEQRTRIVDNNTAVTTASAPQQPEAAMAASPATDTPHATAAPVENPVEAAPKAAPQEIQVLSPTITEPKTSHVQDTAKAGLASAAAPTPVPVTDIAPGIDPKTSIKQWMKDWASQNVDAYLAHYDARFTPADGSSRTEWEAERRRRIMEAKSLRLFPDKLVITQLEPTRATALFMEIMVVNGKKHATRKYLELLFDGTDWRILVEAVIKRGTPLPEPTVLSSTSGTPVNPSIAIPTTPVAALTSAAKDAAMPALEKAIEKVDVAAPVAPPAELSANIEQKPQAVAPIVSETTEPKTSNTTSPAQQAVTTEQPKTETQTSIAAPVAAASPVIAPKDSIKQWMKDWASQNVDAYLAHYDARFTPADGSSRTEWEAERRRRILEAKSLRLFPDKLEITQLEATHATALFMEVMVVNGQKRVNRKYLELLFDGTDWRILVEAVIKRGAPLPEPSVLPSPSSSGASNASSLTAPVVAIPAATAPTATVEDAAMTALEKEAESATPVATAPSLPGTADTMINPAPENPATTQ